MAKDLKIIFDSLYQEFDLGLGKGDLTTDDSLESAVLISLYTDKRAGEDDLLPDSRNTNDVRGWWGDQLVPFTEGDEIGSKIWLLSREKTTTQVYIKLENYIRDALQWMVDDEILTKIDVAIERQNPLPENNTLAFEIKLYKIDDRIVSLNYSYQWDNSL